MATPPEVPPIPTLLAIIVTCVLAAVPMNAAVRSGLLPVARLRPLTILTALLLALAAADLLLLRPVRGARVVLVDVSWSVGIDWPEPGAYARDNGLNESDFRVVLCGAVPAVLARGADVTPADIARAGPEGSDLAAGLRVAAELAGAGGVIVVATDGRVDVEALRAAAATARGAGIGLALCPIGVPRDEPRMTGVVVPGRLPPGVPVFVGATISGPPGLALLVELRIDGHSTTSRGLVISASGRTSLALSVAPPAPGWHEVVVALRGAPGAPENDVAAAGVLVGGPPRVRIVNAPAFARELRTLGYDVGEGAADEPLGNLDLLVLRNVPVTQFERSGAAVREYVEAGGGLLVLGGPRSFGPGGYSGRPVEDALPVRGDPARDGLLAVVLLDCSGTMRESFSNSPGAKLDAARSAVAKLLSSLPDDADFLFVPFTAGPLADGLPLSLREPGGRERAAALIAAAREARGGTAIAPPLRMAGAVAREVAATRPLRRTLVILVTDGRLEEETADEVLDAALSLRRAGARLEVLSVGADADRGFLSRLADSAGRVVEVESDGGLRDAFLDALLSAEGEGMILSGTLHARRGPGRDPEEPAILPAVSGMVRTWARAAAEVPWVAGDDIPLVAHGRFGLGRSAVVTTDPCGDWAPGWAGSGLLSALADLVRRPAALSGPRAEVRRDGPHLLLTAHVDAPVAELRGSLGFAGGTPVPVVLHAAGPGRYEGRVRTDAWGAARLTLAGGESVFDGGVAVSGPSEYGESGQDPARLSALADAFGEPAVPPRGGFAASPFVALIGLVIFLVDRTLLLKKRPLRRR